MNRDRRNFCGFLEYEPKENSGVFIRKLFRLDADTGKLEHFADCDSQVRMFFTAGLIFNLLYIVLYSLK